jgi:L-malate glycosyltransferase
VRIAIAGPVDLSKLSSGIGDVPPHYAFPLLGDLAEELHHRGHDVSIVTTSNAVADNWTHSSERLHVTIVPDMRSPRAKTLDRFREERRRIRDVLASFEVDLINTHWLYEFSAAASALPGPVCMVAHDHPLDILRMLRMPYWWSRVSLGFCLRRPGVFVGAVAPSVADQVHRVFRARRPVELLPNWSPVTHSLRQSMRPQRSRDGQVIVTVLNGVGSAKNPDAALRAFQIVRRVRPGAELVMFGSGYGPDHDLARSARQTGLADGVTFMGQTPHDTLLKWIDANASVLLHPARSEACSIALLEAMSLGIPVVGGQQSGGVPWQLDNGRAGYLVDVEDPNSVARGVLTLFDDRLLLEQIGKAGRARASSLFDRESSITRYEEWFTRCIRSHNMA